MNKTEFDQHLDLLKTVKLGKSQARPNWRRLKFSKYSVALPAPPSDCGYTSQITDWGGALGNDFVGDCTTACACHQILQWTNYTGKPIVPTAKQALAAYSAITGYNPNDPTTDQGAFISDVLKYWEAKGIAGHKIAAFVSVNPKNQTEIKQAIQLFGNVSIGIGLPISAQRPVLGENGLPCWSVPDGGPVGDGAPWTWGGHNVPGLAYGVDKDGNGGLLVNTWGQLYDVTWDFITAYSDEIWAMITPDWIAANGLAPSGFNITQLQIDLAQL